MICYSYAIYSFKLINQINQSISFEMNTQPTIARLEPESSATSASSEQKFSCPICTCRPIFPLCCSANGHLICYICYDKLNKKTTCPICNKECSFVPNIAIRQFLEEENKNDKLYLEQNSIVNHDWNSVITFNELVRKHDLRIHTNSYLFNNHFNQNDFIEKLASVDFDLKKLVQMCSNYQKFPIIMQAQVKTGYVSLKECLSFRKNVDGETYFFIIKPFQ